MELSKWSVRDLQLAKTFLGMKIDQFQPKTVWCGECRDFSSCHTLPDDPPLNKSSQVSVQALEERIISQIMAQFDK
jgi:hypothetical protein